MQALRSEKSRGRFMELSSMSTIGGNEKQRRKVVFMRRPSREEQYEGSMQYCHHNLLAPWWTSWSDGNPGRRFYGFRNSYQDGGCRYFKWHDDGFGERENVVIKDLLNDINKLYKENKQLRRGNACGKLYEGLLHLKVR
ncbi:hypothetical protein QN277_000024 [Acacia crassicarpa]|uniref:Zinc finger GRF-type domain-containing protein n=1 Tax=Acacia crassicarpa TaxID=499986 RepID=A0AAE1N6N1_9FABA|nr:hypothetical protein QN277_000024 [Acacia crassicarpa]